MATKKIASKSFSEFISGLAVAMTGNKKGESAPKVPCRQVVSRQKAVWKLVCLLMLEYKPEDSQMLLELNDLLAKMEHDNWETVFRRFIARYLKDRVRF